VAANNIPGGQNPELDLQPTATTAAEGIDELVLTIRNMPRRSEQDGGGESIGRQQSKMSSSYSPPHQNMLPRNHVIGSRARLAKGSSYIIDVKTDNRVQYCAVHMLTYRPCFTRPFSNRPGTNSPAPYFSSSFHKTV
jgi:hypothetical protein